MDNYETGYTGDKHENPLDNIDLLKRDFIRGELILGGQLITSTAISPDERTQDGQIDPRPARNRGLLSAITKAAYNDGKTLEDQRTINVQEIVSGGLLLGIDPDNIIETLRNAGVSYELTTQSSFDQGRPPNEAESPVRNTIKILKVQPDKPLDINL